MILYNFKVEKAKRQLDYFLKAVFGGKILPWQLKIMQEIEKKKNEGEINDPK